MKKEDINTVLWTNGIALLTSYLYFTQGYEWVKYYYIVSTWIYAGAFLVVISAGNNTLIKTCYKTANSEGQFHRYLLCIPGWIVYLYILFVSQSYVSLTAVLIVKFIIDGTTFLCKESKES